MSHNLVINYDQLVRDAMAIGITRLVVGGVVRDSEGRVLLLRRPADEFMGGIFELPSGKVETQESLFDALARELREETTMSLIGVERYLGYFDYVSKSGRATRQFNFLVFAEGELSLSEHDSFGWFATDLLSEINVTEPVRKVILTV